MQDFPHHYTVAATGEPSGDVAIEGNRLRTLYSAAPVEFDGPGDRWSPETLLCAAVADCYLLSFRGVARAGKIAWKSLGCSVRGTLERVEGKTRFTRIEVEAALVVPEGTDHGKAAQAMERAERVCLISNSLVAERHLAATVTVG